MVIKPNKTPAPSDTPETQIKNYIVAVFAYKMIPVLDLQLRNSKLKVAFVDRISF